MIYRTSFLASLTLMTLLVIPGCGYRFGVEGPGPMIGSGEPPPKGPVVKLAIDPLENRTFEPNLELKYSHYLRQEFRVSSGAEVVDNVKDADFLLNGAIESVSLPSLTFTQNQTQESRVSVQVKVEVKIGERERSCGCKRRMARPNFLSLPLPRRAVASPGFNSIEFSKIVPWSKRGNLLLKIYPIVFCFASEQGVFQANASPTGRPLPTPNPNGLIPFNSLNCDWRQPSKPEPFRTWVSEPFQSPDEISRIAGHHPPNRPGSTVPGHGGRRPILETRPWRPFGRRS